MRRTGRQDRSRAGVIAGEAPGAIVAMSYRRHLAARWNAVVHLDRIDPRDTFGTPVFVRRIILDAVGGT